MGTEWEDQHICTITKHCANQEKKTLPFSNKELGWV